MLVLCVSVVFHGSTFQRFHTASKSESIVDHVIHKTLKLFCLQIISKLHNLLINKIDSKKISPISDSDEELDLM